MNAACVECNRTYAESPTAHGAHICPDCWEIARKAGAIGRGGVVKDQTVEGR